MEIMNTITIDSNIYQGAERYAKLHNLSLKQMVENFLLKFQAGKESISASRADEEAFCPQKNEFLEELSPSLMKGLAEYAVREHRNGHCLTQEQVESSIMEKMGWN